MQKQFTLFVALGLIMSSLEVQASFRITSFLFKRSRANNASSSYKWFGVKRKLVQVAQQEKANREFGQRWLQHLEDESYTSGRRNSNKYKRLLQECKNDINEALGKK